jgi:hypothetical protein
MTWVFNCLPIRVSIEVSQPHIQPDSLARWLSFLNSLNIKTKLNVVAISSTNNPNSLNLFQLIEVQVTGSPQLETSCFKTICESDNSSIFRKFIATGLVLYRTLGSMLFKTWKTFLGCFLFAGFDVRLRR